MDFSCRKFQPNIFNKSRCQNCFKAREQHVTSGEELQQVKPIYAGWLCLAPEGTDFDNPIHRSRKWQRRFFILYEHGRLQFSLDESPSTIPQGIVDLSLCTEMMDAEGRTGQKNALCIITPEQEIFIRGDSKEIINGWSEQLIVFQQVKKQNHRKKSEVSSVQFQEKVECGSGASDMGAVVCRDPCSLEHEDVQSGPAVDLSTACDDDAADEDSLALGRVKNHNHYQHSCSVDSEEGSRLPPSPESWGMDPDPFCSDSSLPRSASSLSGSINSADWELDEDLERAAVFQGESLLSTRAVEKERRGYQHCEEHSSTNSSRIDGDGVSVGKVCQCCRRRGRSRSQTCAITNYNNKENSAGGLEAPQSILHPHRRARSVDGWASDSTLTPDLLNFKKGYLLTLDDKTQWRKYWSVLSAHSLRFYSDSGVEEASELMGEIDLTTCHKVTEYSIQRNCGFQLHTDKLVYTLAAVTAGIRQNWIQALLENIQSRSAPDVASLVDNQMILQVKAQRGPDVTQDSRLSHNRRHRRNAESDWDEIGQINHTGVKEVNGELDLQHLQPEKQQEELETQIQSWSRRRRREERRQRYEFVMASSGRPMEDRASQDHQDHNQQQRMREIEERWLQVEKTSIRDRKKVLLYPESQSRSSTDLEGIVEHYQRKNPTNSHEIPCKPQMMIVPNKQNPVSALTDKYLQTKQLLQLENLRRQHLKTQLSSDLLTEPELKPVCNTLDCETALNKSRLGSHAWRESSWDWEDEQSGARVDRFSQGDVMLLGKQNVGSGPAVVEQLEAMNQHNQELLNQLAEANREIDRLKAELLCQPNCCQPGLEPVVESLTVELARNSRELQVAQNRLAEVEENLKDAQKTLQLREATLRGLGFLGGDSDDTLLILSSSSISNSSSEEIYLARFASCVQDLEIKVSELESLESNLNQNVDQNAFLRESTLLNSSKTMPAEGVQLETLIETNDQGIQDVWKSLDGFWEEDVAEERVWVRSNNLKMLLEVIRALTRNWPSEYQNSLVDSDVLHLERNVWDSLVNALKKDNLTNSIETDGSDSLVQCVQKKLDEIRMDLLALSINISTGSNANNPHSQNSDSDQHSSNTFPNLTNFDNTGLHNGPMEDHSVQKFGTVPVVEHLDNHPIWRCLKHHIEKKLALLNHVELASKLEPSVISPTNWADCSQTDDSSKSLDPWVSAAMDIFMACLVGYCDTQNQERTLKPIAEELNNSMKGVDLYDGTLLQPNNMATQEKTGVIEENETETMNLLRSHIKELEIQLSRSAETLASLQEQHKEDQTNLKATYEQRFIMLKKSHRKLIEELLLQHQQEQQHLLEEKERLLAEETAATRTVIEAMKRAHNSEMERVQQKTNWEKSNGYTNIAEILKNHSEELAAVQRELDALSWQFSQKCLESAHLAQALEAERKALQHCQYQNLALSTCSQELYGHLDEEIIRLSAAERDSCDLAVSRQQYELEDKKLVTEKYKEKQTDLSVEKERAEEQKGYLREHLRLAYETLSESVEERTLLNS